MSLPRPRPRPPRWPGGIVTYSTADPPAKRKRALEALLAIAANLQSQSNNKRKAT